MSEQICSMDHLIDRLDMSEYDRANAKAQVRRAEMIVDGVEYFVQAAGKLVRSLTPSRFKGAHQH